MSKNILIRFFCIVLLALSVPSNIVFATEVNTSNQTTTVNTVERIEPNMTYNPYSEVPNVTVDEVNDIIVKKGNQIVSVLQNVALYVSIVTFIIGLIMSVVGIMGHGGLFTKGIITVMISCIVFTLVQYAQPIMIYFKNFLIS